MRFKRAKSLFIFRAELFGKSLDPHLQRRNLAAFGGENVKDAVKIGLGFSLNLSLLGFFLEEFKTILNEV